jgi:hypothetical protein
LRPACLYYVYSAPTLPSFLHQLCIPRPELPRSFPYDRHRVYRTIKVTQPHRMAATVEQVADWDSNDLLGWILKEWPKLLAKADDFDTFRAAEITGDEFVIADEQFFEILGFSKRLTASLALRVRSLRRDGAAAKRMCTDCSMVLWKPG